MQAPPVGDHDLVVLLFIHYLSHHGHLLFPIFIFNLTGTKLEPKRSTLLPSAMGTQFCSKWGPNGDPILSEMGT